MSCFGGGSLLQSRLSGYNFAAHTMLEVTLDGNNGPLKAGNGALRTRTPLLRVQGSSPAAGRLCLPPRGKLPFLPTPPPLEHNSEVDLLHLLHENRSRHNLGPSSPVRFFTCTSVTATKYLPWKRHRRSCSGQCCSMCLWCPERQGGFKCHARRADIAEEIANSSQRLPFAREESEVPALREPHKLAARDTSSLQMWPCHPRELMTRAPGKGLPVANVPQITARCLQRTRRSQTSPLLQRKRSAAPSPAGGRSVGEEGAPLATSRVNTHPHPGHSTSASAAAWLYLLINGHRLLMGSSCQDQNGWGWV